MAALKNETERGHRGPAPRPHFRISDPEDPWQELRRRWQAFCLAVAKAATSDLRDAAETMVALGQWTERNPAEALLAVGGLVLLVGGMVLAVGGGEAGVAGGLMLVAMGATIHALLWQYRPRSDEQDERELEEMEAEADFALWQVDPWLALEAGADPQQMLEMEKEEQRREEQAEKLKRFARAVGGKPTGPAPEPPPGQGDPPQGGTGRSDRQRERDRHTLESDDLARIACVQCGQRTTVPKTSPHKCRGCVDWHALSDREKKLKDPDGHYLYPPPVDTGTMKRSYGRGVAKASDPVWSDGSPVELVPWARGQYEWAVDELENDVGTAEQYVLVRERATVGEEAELQVEMYEGGQHHVFVTLGRSDAVATVACAAGWTMVVLASPEGLERAPLPEKTWDEAATIKVRGRSGMGLLVPDGFTDELVPPEAPANIEQRGWP